MKEDLRPAGIKALSILFLFGAFISSMSAALLLFPGSIMDQTSAPGSPAQQGFSGAWTLPLMAIVCVACVAAAAGLWRMATWGLWTAVVVLGANAIGDTISVFSTGEWRTLLAVPIFAFMIWYLLRQRRLFEGSGRATLAQGTDPSAHTSA
jgi:hypothetical protein